MDVVYALFLTLHNVAPLIADDSSVVDGHWIMQRTGLRKGRALGKFKAWLHRIQIERDLASEEEIEDVLCSLHWSEENYLDWPVLQFPE